MDDQKKHIEMLEMLADKKGYQRGLLEGRAEIKKEVLRELKLIMARHREIEAKGELSVPLLIVANRIAELEEVKS